LPSGNAVLANLHLARAVSRRCERRLATLRDEDCHDSVRNTSLMYLNRLSDWLFVLCRVISSRLGEDEELWVPLGKRNP
nr:ATP:cob(I)alamin adenosyltransferase [Euryarchaeota archaeon]